MAPSRLRARSVWQRQRRRVASESGYAGAASKACRAPGSADPVDARFVGRPGRRSMRGDKVTFRIVAVAGLSTASLTLVHVPRLYSLALGAHVLKHPAAWETV